jgi:hypothetical protein
VSKTKLEEVSQGNEYAIETYMENVTVLDFVADIQALMAAYSDGAAIERAIELLKTCQT